MEPRDLSANPEYRAGRGIEEVARELGRDPDEFVVLSSNENPLGPSPKAVEAIRTTAERVHRYPKAAHVDLTEALATKWDVHPDQVWLANGGDGALDYLSRAFLDPGESVLVPDPGFAYYGMSARYHHGRPTSYPLSKADDFAQSPEAVLGHYNGERIIYLNTPHNPTGSRIAIDDISQLAEDTEDATLIVVDEAYGEFMAGESATSLLTDRDDIAILRTFSKAYGLAGLRLGFALVPKPWADAYASVNTPFAASELACRAGLAALEDLAHVKQTVKTVEWSRDYLTDNLQARTWESHGNFVLAEVGDATRVSDALQERGVIVRDCTSFGLPSCIRITCGTKDETKRTVRAVNEVPS